MCFAVCIDSSSSSDAALEYAASLAEELDVKIELIHVVEPAVRFDTNNGPVQESISEAEEKGSKIMESAERELEDYDVEYSTHLLHGEPVRAIVEYLKEDGVHAVFIGHRNLDEAKEELFGSFAKSLVGTSPVPVTVVQDDDSNLYEE